MNTIQLSYEDDADLCRKCRAIIEAREPKPERITIGDLARRVGRPVPCVSRALRRPSAPPFIGRQGKRRLLWIEPTTELLAWLINGRKESTPLHNPRQRHILAQLDGPCAAEQDGERGHGRRNARC
jgi:hypothetical protein